MQMNRLMRRLAVVVVLIMLEPLAMGALADKGGVPSSGGNGIGAASGPADHSNAGGKGNDSPGTSNSNKPDLQDESNCDGDSGGKSDTGKGANTSGPYDNTCPDGQSENGNGGGNAVGKPCAGCVGQADDKNPKGQMPNAEEDGNRGYECDANQGIGKGNPAHTGCGVSTQEEPPPAPPSPPAAPSPPVPPSPPAPPSPPGPSAEPSVLVLGESFQKVEVLGAGQLPRTGLDPFQLLFLALVLTGIGLLTARLGRRGALDAG